MPSPDPRRIPPVKYHTGFFICALGVQHLPQRKGKAKTVASITCCGCIGKGQVKISADFEKQNFNFGETAVILAEIDNSDSAADISSINGELVMGLSVRTPRFSHTERVTLSRINGRGVAAGEKMTGKNAQRLPIMINGSGIAPTCMGGLIVNAFSLRVKVNPDTIRTCCDSTIAVDVPVNISNKPPTVQPVAWQQPNNWKPQQMKGFTAKVDMGMAKGGGAAGMMYPEEGNQGGMMSPNAPVIGNGPGDQYHSLDQTDDQFDAN